MSSVFIWSLTSCRPATQAEANCIVVCQAAGGPAAERSAGVVSGQGGQLGWSRGREVSAGGLETDRSAVRSIGAEKRGIRFGQMRFI